MGRGAGEANADKEHLGLGIQEEYIKPTDDIQRVSYEKFLLSQHYRFTLRNRLAKPYHQYCVRAFGTIVKSRLPTISSEAFFSKSAVN